MTASVHVLHPRPNSVDGYLRVGHTGQRKLEALLAANRIGFRRFVFEAKHIAEQVDLAKSLKTQGHEILLDPNFAETSTNGRFNSSVSKLPWANPDRPWAAIDFNGKRNIDFAKSIADFAVQFEVDAVLTPSHLVDEAPSSWINIDLALCEALRRELDYAGAKNIELDFQIITTNTLLKDADFRAMLTEKLRNIPFENLWIRSSGFGASASGAATRSFVESFRHIHTIEKPVVADFAGGLAALAALSFGAAGAISHGVGQKEGFKCSDWHRKPSGKGGSSSRIYVSELDRHFKRDQIEHFSQCAEHVHDFAATTPIVARMATRI